MSLTGNYKILSLRGTASPELVSGKQPRRHPSLTCIADMHGEEVASSFLLPMTSFFGLIYFSRND